jgi:hypothetical protein
VAKQSSTGHVAAPEAMPIPTELFATMTGRLAPGGRPGTITDAVAVWRALFKKFSPLIGPLSTELLFARSLATHEGAFPWLPQAMPGTLRPVFEEFERSLASRTSDEIVAVNRALLASYTTGLAELIGPGLVTRFVRAAFPPDESNKNS